MTELKIEPKIVSVELDDLKDIEDNINIIIYNDSSVMKSILKLILDYNRLFIENNNLLFTEYLSKKNVVVTNSDKNELNGILQSYQTNKIYNIHLEKDFRLYIEEKISLMSLYNYFRKDYLKSIKKELNYISSIKCFDFCRDDENHNLVVEKLLSDVKKMKIIEWLKTKTEKTKNIQILTPLNTATTYKFYETLLDKKDNIKIKYISNFKIPSLFYILIKYKINDNSNNYKNLILYLEPSTNWAVITTVSQTGFSSQFFKLLDTRFDIKHNSKYAVDFIKVDKENTNFFEKEIDDIFVKIDTFLINTYDKVLEDDLIRDINRLKIYFPTINYGYKLLKDILGYISTTHKLKHSEQSLKNTKYIISKILDSNINSKVIETFKDISQEDILKFEDIDIYKLRLGIIQPISNTSICDLFSDMLWQKEDEIIKSLLIILNNKDKLSILFKEIDIMKDFSFSEMEYIYKNEIINYIKNGEKIRINK